MAREAGRPVGEVRVALRDAVQALAQEQGGATWRDAAARAQVGWDAAQLTIKRMVHAGELMPVGTVRAPDARRPLTRYVPAWSAAGSCAGGQRWSATEYGDPLHGVFKAWVR